MQGAVGLATNEENLRKRVNMSKSFGSYNSNNVQTRMEVDHARGQKFNKKIPRVQIVRERKLKCWNCGEEGHISRDCEKERDDKPPMGHGQGFRRTEKRPGRQQN